MPVSISFSGYRHRKRLVRSIIEWYVPKYIGKHQLEIDIEDKGLNREGMYGSCVILDCTYRPRWFSIEMNNTLDLDDYVRTLFHELIHVKQRVHGEFKTYCDGSNYWWGKPIDPDTNYMDLPWEKEAHELEDTVTHEYLSQCTTAPICYAV